MNVNYYQSGHDVYIVTWYCYCCLLTIIISPVMVLISLHLQSKRSIQSLKHMGLWQQPSLEVSAFISYTFYLKYRNHADGQRELNVTYILGIEFWHSVGVTALVIPVDLHNFYSNVLQMVQDSRLQCVGCSVYIKRHCNVSACTFVAVNVFALIVFSHIIRHFVTEYSTKSTKQKV